MRQLKPWFRCEGMGEFRYECINGCDRNDIHAYTHVVDRSIPDGFRELCDDCMRDVEFTDCDMYQKYNGSGERFIFYNIDGIRYIGLGTIRIHKLEKI